MIHSPDVTTPGGNPAKSAEQNGVMSILPVAPAKVNAVEIPDLTEAGRLFKAGFKMCRLMPNSKRPDGEGWNINPVKTFDSTATGYGVILAVNGLCSVDPDNAELSQRMLAGFGFDLEALLNAGVRSLSTRLGSGGRSAFEAPAGLAWVKFSFKDVGTVLELRAASPNLQDVVPGLVYADGQGVLCTQRYANARRLDDRPTLPAEFLAWWLRMSEDVEFRREQQRKAGEILGIKPHLAISGGSGGKTTLAFPSNYRREFNLANSVEDLLGRHGYTQHGERFAPPTATGLPGVRLVPGKEDLWQSDHGSDPLFGTFDPWSAFVVLDHDGDLTAAEAVAECERQNAIIGEFTNYAEEEQRDARQRIETLLKTGVDFIDVTADDFEKAINDALPAALYAKHDYDALMVRISEAIGKPEAAVRQSLAKRPKFASTPIAELMAGPPARWIIKRLLPQADFGVLYGETGSGKSFMVLDMALAIARGVPWRDRKVNQGRVTYVCAEGAGGLTNRLKAYGQQHGVDMATVPFSPITRDIPNLLNDADHLQLAKQINAEGGAALVILDTLAQTMPGGSENSSEDMGKAISHCRAIAATTGALVLVIHHAGKNLTAGARGWSGLKAAADVELCVERTDSTRYMHVTKSKDSGDFEKFGFQLQVVPLGEDEDGEPIDSCTIEHKMDAVVEGKKITGAVKKAVVKWVEDLVGLGGELPTIEDVVEAVVEAELATSTGPEKWDKKTQRNRSTYIKKVIDKMLTDEILAEIDGRLALWSAAKAEKG